MATSRIVNDMVQGDTPTWGITVYSDIAKTTLVDTTGYEVWVTFKSDRDLTDANAELQVNAITTSADGANGIVSVKPTISESKAVPAGVYFYDFQVRTADGTIQTPDIGTVRVEQSVTLDD